MTTYTFYRRDETGDAVKFADLTIENGMASWSEGSDKMQQFLASTHFRQLDGEKFNDRNMEHISKLPQILQGRYLWVDAEGRMDAPGGQRASITIRAKGGPGSGHHGHKGRPGKVGGSVPGTGRGGTAGPKGIGPSGQVRDIRKGIRDKVRKRGGKWEPHEDLNSIIEQEFLRGIATEQELLWLGAGYTPDEISKNLLNDVPYSGQNPDTHPAKSLKPPTGPPPPPPPRDEDELPEGYEPEPAIWTEGPRQTGSRGGEEASNAPASEWIGPDDYTTDSLTTEQRNRLKEVMDRHGVTQEQVHGLNEIRADVGEHTDVHFRYNEGDPGFTRIDPVTGDVISTTVQGFYYDDWLEGERNIHLHPDTFLDHNGYVFIHELGHHVHTQAYNDDGVSFASGIILKRIQEFALETENSDPEAFPRAMEGAGLRPYSISNYRELVADSFAIFMTGTIQEKVNLAAIWSTVGDMDFTREMLVPARKIVDRDDFAVSGSTLKFLQWWKERQ